MARLGGDIAVAEQRALVHVGIELGLHFLVFEIARPAHEIRHRSRRPVAVEHLDDETARSEIARHIGKRVGGRPRQQTMGRLIAVDRPADEIVRSGIAHLDDEPGHHGRGIDESGGALLRPGALLGRASADDTHREAHAISAAIQRECADATQQSDAFSRLDYLHSDTHWASSFLNEPRHGLARHGSLGLDRARVVARAVEVERAGQLHVELPFADQMKVQLLAVECALDRRADGVDRGGLRRERRQQVLDLLRP